MHGTLFNSETLQFSQQKKVSIHVQFGNIWQLFVTVGIYTSYGQLLGLCNCHSIGNHRDFCTIFICWDIWHNWQLLAANCYIGNIFKFFQLTEIYRQILANFGSFRQFLHFSISGGTWEWLHLRAWREFSTRSARLVRDL